MAADAHYRWPTGRRLRILQCKTNLPTWLPNVWPAEFNKVPQLQGIKSSLDSVVEGLGFLRAQAASIKGNQHLTPAGQKDGIRKHIAQATSRTIKAGEKLIAETRDGLTAWRGRLLPPPPKCTKSGSMPIAGDCRP
jgi:hypothetical protein